MNDDRMKSPLSMGRRNVLVSSMAFVWVSACSRVSGGSTNQQEASVPVTNVAFLKISRVLTGHTDLDELAAARHLAALVTFFPDANSQWQTLAPLIDGAASPMAALAACESIGMKGLALSIVAGWYTGTFGNGVQAISVSYRNALMQRPTADALAPPTYALGGPAWWVAAPPEVVVGRRTRTALEPATVGNPEPKKP